MSRSRVFLFTFRRSGEEGKRGKFPLRRESETTYSYLPKVLYKANSKKRQKIKLSIFQSICRHPSSAEQPSTLQTLYISAQPRSSSFLNTVPTVVFHIILNPATPCSNCFSYYTSPLSLSFDIPTLENHVFSFHLTRIIPGSNHLRRSRHY